MTSIILNGVPIDFPVEPYEIQKEFMEKVLECLQNETNGILESPTGTGKTLSLLCSSLAWLQLKKAQVQAQIQISGIEEGTDFLNKLNSELCAATKKSGFSKKLCGVPTIIYASRTHSQLSQAMKELKKTSYKYMKAAVLGSREQLCIHPEVIREKNNAFKIHLCQMKVKSKSCHFQNRVERVKDDPAITEVSVRDIEDLVKLGNCHKFCPYYMTRELIKDADIIFMPYNYLLDQRMRKTLDLHLANHVVILDEAHNVEKLCEENASFQIKSSDIALAVDEITTIMKMISEEVMSFEDSPKDFTAEDLCALKQIFLDLEKQIDDIEVTVGGKTLEGAFIFELFDKIGIGAGNFKIVIGLISNIIRFLATAGEGPFARRGAGLQNFEDIFNILYAGFCEDYKKKVNKCCKVHIAQEEVKQRKPDNWLSKATAKSSEKILSYWCFSPGFGMNMLMSQGLRTLILTSGTLAPLKPLISELEINVGVRLENPHIIKEDQVFVQIVSAGPDMEVLNSSFQNRENPKYVSSLGRAILNVTRVIPNGLLIFFPSYPIMLKCQKSWQDSGIWGNINDQKAIYVEPRDKESFNNAMQEYYKKINDPSLKGAIFMGVCRGKVSEGLDFADANGRAVIITGLPYPPLKDPRVVLKRQYLDVCNSIDKDYLRGEDWYSLEASRAVNQAIGRVIRHEHDYGAILLLDTRFNYFKIKSQMSMWLRNFVKVSNNFGVLMRDLKIFFKNAEMKHPIGETKRKTAPTSAEFDAPNTYRPGNFNFGTSSAAASSSSHLGDGEVAIHGNHHAANPAKRKKIILKPNLKSSSSSDTSTKEYILMVKKSLADGEFKELIKTMQDYKDTADFDQLTRGLDRVFKDQQRHLALGLESYVKEPHKDMFRSYCERNTYRDIFLG